MYVEWKLFGSHRNDPSQKVPPDNTAPLLPQCSPMLNISVKEVWKLVNRQHLIICGFDKTVSYGFTFCRCSLNTRSQVSRWISNGLVDWWVDDLYVQERRLFLARGLRWNRQTNTSQCRSRHRHPSITPSNSSLLLPRRMHFPRLSRLIYEHNPCTWNCCSAPVAFISVNGVRMGELFRAAVSVMIELCHRGSRENRFTIYL